MATAQFIKKLWESYAAMSPRDRREKIRESVIESKDNAKFIREQFPDFYAEAFPPSNQSS